MFETVNLLISQLFLGMNVMGQLIAIREQLMSQLLDLDSYVIVNLIDSVLKLFS